MNNQYKTFSAVRLFLVFFMVVSLSACSKIKSSRASSNAVRVSVLSGEPLPQVAENAMLARTGKLKVYIMDEEDTYRKDIVQEVDVNYGVPAVAKEDRVRVASLARKAEPKPIRRVSVTKQIPLAEPPKVQRYKGSKSSTVTIVPPTSPQVRRPVRVPELPLADWQQPKPKAKKELSEYHAILSELKVNKRPARKKATKKSRKKRSYNYFKGKKPEATKKSLKKKRNNKSIKNKSKKKKWKWDSSGRLLRV